MSENIDSIDFKRQAVQAEEAQEVAKLIQIRKEYNTYIKKVDEVKTKFSEIKEKLKTASVSVQRYHVSNGQVEVIIANLKGTKNALAHAERSLVMEAGKLQKACQKLEELKGRIDVLNGTIETAKRVEKSKRENIESEVEGELLSVNKVMEAERSKNDDFLENEIEVDGGIDRNLLNSESSPVKNLQIFCDNTFYHQEFCSSYGHAAQQRNRDYVNSSNEKNVRNSAQLEIIKKWRDCLNNSESSNVEDSGLAVDWVLRNGDSIKLEVKRSTEVSLGRVVTENALKKGSKIHVLIEASNAIHKEAIELEKVSILKILKDADIYVDLFEIRDLKIRKKEVDE